MTYWFEQAAYNNEPMPDNITAYEACIYTFLRNLYWSYKQKLITKEQAQHEKTITINKYDREWEKRDFEIKCWENSARRTLAACHAMTMYRQNRTLENADVLVNRLEWLEDECAIQVKPHEHGANCPICGKFFNQDHAARKPTYCESCGCRLGWDDHNEGEE